MDPEKWISQRAESNEGPTIYEFTQVFKDVPYDSAKQLFTSLEKEGLLYRTTVFTGGFRAYTMNEPPVGITPETELFHDVLDYVAEQSFQPQRNEEIDVEAMDVILFHRAFSALSQKHKGLTERQLARVFHVLDGRVLVKPKKLSHVWEFVSKFEDLDDFDDLLTDAASDPDLESAPPKVTEKLLELWLKKDYERLIANEVLQNKPEPKVEAAPVPKESAPAPTPKDVASIPTPEPESKIEKPVEAPVKVAPLSSQPTLFDRMLEESTQVNANPRAIRRMQKLGTFLSDLGQGLDRVGQTLTSFGQLLDTWQEEDIGNNLDL